jgi:hypothetical protein
MRISFVGPRQKNSAVTLARNDRSAMDSRQDQTTESAPVKRTTVPVDTLLPAQSPRSCGEDEEHIRRLAESEAELPPILVQQGSMRVIDGMHRLRAAILNGHSTIEVEFFDGSNEEAFIRAVERNVTHGLPLTLADRKAAATRILGWRPAMSDRAVASMTGLSPKTVGAIRAYATEESRQSNDRQGRDGRLRPLNSREGRRRAAEVLEKNPNASIREIAALAGISAGTARSVQARLRAGDDPVLDRLRRSSGVGNRKVGGAGDISESASTTAGIGEPGSRDRQAVDEISIIITKLCKDPALRHSEAGRQLLQIIRTKTVDEPLQIALMQASPPHSRPLLAKLARYNASVWKKIASDLDQ